jgi:hypothetical protein
VRAVGNAVLTPETDIESGSDGASGKGLESESDEAAVELLGKRRLSFSGEGDSEQHEEENGFTGFWKEMSRNGRVVLKNCLPKLADEILSALQTLEKLESEKRGSKIVRVNSKDQETNVFQNVERAPDPEKMQFVFLRPEDIEVDSMHSPEDISMPAPRLRSAASITSEFENLLKNTSGLNFNANHDHLQIFISHPGGENSPHQDRDTGKGRPHFVAVLMISDPDDFADPNNPKDGSVYLNKAYKSVSPNGKKVGDEDVSGREHVRLGRGDVLIFNNDDQIHGVEPPTRGSRMTFSVRCVADA